MGRRLILLPVHLGLRAVRVGLKAARMPFDIVGGLTGAGGHEAGTGEHGGGPDERGGGPDERGAESAGPDGAAEVILGRDRMRAAARAAGPTADAPPPSAPASGATSLDGGAVGAGESAHVADAPELVGEFAEAGAGDGAHAEVGVAEPWEGYAVMKARDIEERLAGATAEEVAVVRLYETTHKRRQSVLRATERRMRQQAAERRRPR